jgi:hypothetical protein
MFENKPIPLIHCATQGISISNSLHDKRNPRRMIVEEVINNSYAWAFFDGATRGDPQVSGIGGVFF